jgi:ABC-type dipeptide/oligopeptide/nickel transport system permease component
VSVSRCSGLVVGVALIGPVVNLLVDAAQVVLDPRLRT